MNPPAPAREAAVNRHIEPTVCVDHELGQTLGKEDVLLWECLPVGLCYVDRDLRCRAHNRQFAEIAGVPRDAMQGRSLSEVLPPATRAVLEDLVPCALSGRHVSCEEEIHPGELPSDTLRTTLAPHRDSTGQVVGFHAILQEVSERSEVGSTLGQANARLEAMNAQLRDAQGQLHQAAKLASIGQLASGVAHEINNPIGFVSSNLGTLERYLADVFGLLERYAQAFTAVADDTLRAQLDEARAAADIDFVSEDALALLAESKEGIARVKQIVADLKNFSRSSDDEAWQWADLHSGLDTTLNIVKNELRYKADVRKAYGQLPEVQCRPSQINQVFMNMLVNAADAIVERGVILIRSGTERGHAWVEFEDTGAGIAKELLPRIFDPFFTTKPVGKGTGLGLAVSYGIVAEHGGHIDVTSEPGCGTTFRVWLPIEQRTERDVNAASAAPIRGRAAESTARPE